MPTPTPGRFLVDAIPRELHEDLVAGVLRRLPVIVGRLDAAGCICDVAGAGLAHHGLDPRQLQGARFLALFPEGQHALERARAGEPARFEACLNAGTVGAWYVQFDLFHDSDGGAGPLFVGQDVTTRRTLEGQIMHAVEGERHRLGADLHDEVGQLLTGITCLGTALVARLRGRDDLAAEDARMIAEAAKEALAQIRSLAHGLAPVHLARRGLAGALEELRTQTLRMHRVEVRLHLPGTRIDFGAETTAHLFRIAQEAITNAIRHGKATSIDVSLWRVGRQHRLAIADNGRGFDPKIRRRAAGSGLELMAYRAALIRGGFAVSSEPRNGTRIEISFAPLATCAHENAC